MTSLFQIFWNRHHVIIDPYPCRIQLQRCVIYMKKNKLLLRFGVIGMYAYRSWTPPKNKNILFFTVCGGCFYISFLYYLGCWFISFYNIYCFAFYVCLFVCLFCLCFLLFFSFCICFDTISYERYCILQNTNNI